MNTSSAGRPDALESIFGDDPGTAPQRAAGTWRVAAGQNLCPQGRSLRPAASQPGIQKAQLPRHEPHHEIPHMHVDKEMSEKLADALPTLKYVAAGGAMLINPLLGGSALAAMLIRDYRKRQQAKGS